MRADIESLKERLDMQTSQTGTLNQALNTAEERIEKFKSKASARITGGALKVHVPKVDLSKEFFGKPNNNVEDFLIDCNMYIAARRAEFTNQSAAALMVLGQFRGSAALIMRPW